MIGVFEMTMGRHDESKDRPDQDPDESEAFSFQFTSQAPRSLASELLTGSFVCSVRKGAFALC